MEVQKGQGYMIARELKTNDPGSVPFRWGSEQNMTGLFHYDSNKNVSPGSNCFWEHSQI